MVVLTDDEKERLPAEISRETRVYVGACRAALTVSCKVVRTVPAAVDLAKRWAPLISQDTGLRRLLDAANPAVCAFENSSPDGHDLVALKNAIVFSKGSL